MTDIMDILIIEAIDSIRASHEEAKRIIHASREEFARRDSIMPDGLIQLYCDIAMHIADFEQTLQQLSNKK